MQSGSPHIQKLMSLPERMAEYVSGQAMYPRPEWVTASDPPGRRLGSGGATAHLLVEAWRQTGNRRSMADWLHEGRKLILHGGGQSRRLPAYAATGKLFIPVPVFRWTRGQRLDQSLLDVQLPVYERVLAHAPGKTVAMVASGDVLLRLGEALPTFPEVDVLGLGLWVNPETAKDFGVFFSHRSRPQEIEFFLQKPSVARIRQLNTEYLPLVDTGMWLLSERAVQVLLELCGWDAGREAFPAGAALPYDLYAEFGASLGTKPQRPDPRIRALTTAVVPLPGADFFHLGASRHLVESVSRIQSLELDESKIGLMGARQYPSQFLQNCRFEFPLSLDVNHTLWVENSVVPSRWRLASEHVLTGIPDNDWELALEPGVCIDVVPVEEAAACVRVYHIDDSFRGALGDPATKWLDQPARRWFERRGIQPADAGLDPDTDIHEAALFPALPDGKLDPQFLAWMFQSEPAADARLKKAWLGLKRLSAAVLCGQINLDRYFAQRAQNRSNCLAPLLNNARFSVFYKLDLAATAGLFAEGGHELPPADHASRARLEPMQQVRDQMFRSAVLRRRGQSGWEQHARRAFELMRELIIGSVQLQGVRPVKRTHPDQIIWGRCPVRFDLAGGWTDTPPYCLENGGQVVNLAVDLNGQPPVQVFARLSEKPELVLRSIDLGLEHRIRTYDELDTFGQLNRPFPLAKAALALAGFLPRFLEPPHYGSLEEQLNDFGGGIEVSMLAAVPKGSGLGTSSILAATLLGTLSDLCGLGWNLETLFNRTLALEQMLTTGGGWQDQAGGIYRGIKLIETGAGLAQRPSLQWLPEHLFGEMAANKSVLLYYTGVTRLAKNILDEIVRNIFLNAGGPLRILEDIGANASVAANAIQCCDYPGLVAAVRTSWELNQALDSGTNPPAIQVILDQVGDWLAAAKLLGAGGGGYMLMLAKDDEAAGRIKRSLTDHAPNPTARFVHFSISQTGLQKTWS